MRLLRRPEAVCLYDQKRSLYCLDSGKVIFLIVCWTVGDIGGLSVKDGGELILYRNIVLQDGEKIIGISSYRTMKNKLSAPRQKVSKNAPG